MRKPSSHPKLATVVALGATLLAGSAQGRSIVVDFSKDTAAAAGKAIAAVPEEPGAFYDVTANSTTRIDCDSGTPKCFELLPGNSLRFGIMGPLKKGVMKLTPIDFPKAPKPAVDENADGGTPAEEETVDKDGIPGYTLLVDVNGSKRVIKRSLGQGGAEADTLELRDLPEGLNTVTLFLAEADFDAFDVSVGAGLHESTKPKFVAVRAPTLPKGRAMPEKYPVESNVFRGKAHYDGGSFVFEGTLPAPFDKMLRVKSVEGIPGSEPEQIRVTYEPINNDPKSEEEAEEARRDLRTAESLEEGARSDVEKERLAVDTLTSRQREIYYSITDDLDTATIQSRTAELRRIESKQSKAREELGEDERVLGEKQGETSRARATVREKEDDAARARNRQPDDAFTPDGRPVLYTVVQETGHGEGIPNNKMVHVRLVRVNLEPEFVDVGAKQQFEADILVALDRSGNFTITPPLPDGPKPAEGGADEPISWTVHTIKGSEHPQGVVYGSGQRTGALYKAWIAESAIYRNVGKCRARGCREWYI